MKFSLSLCATILVGTATAITLTCEESIDAALCTSRERLVPDRSCCKYNDGCPGIPKCTAGYCCEENSDTTATIAYMSPVPVAGSGGYYEPVSQTITCAVKEWEGGFTCSVDKVLDDDKECCRYQGNCGNLSKCERDYCCVDSGTLPQPSPAASSTPRPPSYETECGASDAYITCDTGYSLESDIECCAQKGLCGSMKYCSKSQCCTKNVATSPEPTIPPAAGDACSCAGPVINEFCYSSLSEALSKASEGDTLYFGGDHTVSSPIQFETETLNFVGIQCNGQMAKLIGNFNEVNGGILEPRNPSNHDIVVKDLEVTGASGSSAAFLKGLGSETDAGSQGIKLVLNNVYVHDMSGQRLGVGIFIGVSKGLVIDEDCRFENIIMSTEEENMYAGGAAVSVIYLSSNYEISIGGTFKNCESWYPKASLHSGGGAVYLDYMEGDVVFTALFEGNQANQGGAVHVQGVLGEMLVKGVYINNKAVDDGYGSRSGAFRVLKIFGSGKLIISATFTDNTAQGRGGVIATNIHLSGSQVIFMDAVFQNNVASTVGGVWSFWSSTTIGGSIIFEDTCEFNGNQAIQNSGSSIYDIAGSDDSSMMSEDEWTGERVVVA
ncbi:hypothetical protein SARC_06928 [Sphaeroforma arctica JP610]|uniref:Right handed beta helix domain-containing protein n=1 Tax=Sphaeroforma arctica JP610 TaxID=667725 RepID=A0A0L0FV71_9EUKA|nr:hypothetical protein SARC_06928 [Sphaeroforma arctica JP610]KNC80727.1 hypothetical protein SARC_06928 [Sphaeroforma arctica JP610]|eukprot:XP_014154629.1 hypothetical protein SARC_06928 [Sphaeroforma arctica JP610]